MPALIVKKGPQPGRRYEFRKDAVIGRGADVDLTIKDRSISRHHAALSVDRKGVKIRDLESQNGTAVNGFVLKAPMPLRQGDEVRIGAVLLEFRDESRSDIDVSSVHLLDSRHEILQSIEATNAGVSLTLEGDGRPTVATLGRRLRLLHDVSVALHEKLDENALLTLILSKLFEVFPRADRGVILLFDPEKDELQPVSFLARSGIPPEVVVSRTLAWDVVRNRRGILSLNALMDPRFGEAGSVVNLGIRSVISVPMIADEKVLGLISLDSLKSSSAFGKDDMALLVGLSAHAALALAKSRLHAQLLDRELLQHDLALARKIQARFLPRHAPRRAGWSFQAYYAPAIEVGGDYFDFVELPGDQIGIAIGDVSGKGVSAALFMVKLSTEMRYHSVGQMDPAEVLKRVNRVVAKDNEEAMFVTATFAVLDVMTGRMRLASAGHLPPLVRRQDGSVVEIRLPKAAPLGVNEAGVFSSRELTLEEGETVVLYSDGVSEATKKGGELFGEARLVERLSNGDANPESVVTRVLDAVQGFVEDEPQSDDITLVCFGRVRTDTTERLEAGTLRGTWRPGRVTEEGD